MADIGKDTVQERSVWGLWATLGWVVLALVSSQIIGTVVLILLRPDAISAGMDALVKDGVVVTPPHIPANAGHVIILALGARRPGWSFTEYLGLVRPAARDAAAALWMLVILLLGYDALTYVLGRDIVTPFQLDTYRSAQNAGMLPLFWFALVVAAPVAE